jgi:preprotein translocase subunit YajC
MKKFITTMFSFGAVILGSSLFAEEVDVSQSKPGGYLQTVLMIVVFLLIFYFILWRPERKRRKKMEEQRTSLKTGDRVTAMGIIGTVVEIKENTMILKMYDGAKVEFLKAAITDVQSSTEVQSASNS